MLEFYDSIATLGDIPDLHAARSPMLPALLFAGRETSYGELARRSNRVANGLLALGLAKGSRVGLLGFDSEKSYELLFGCAKAGLVMMSVNWRLKPDEIAFILQDAEVEVLLLGPEQAAGMLSWRPQCPRLRQVIRLGPAEGRDFAYDDWLASQKETCPGIALSPEEPAVQVYTSGTSGRPKGVVLAHRCFLALAREVVRAGDELVDWRPGETSLVALPSFHVGGLWWAIHGLINGARNVLLKHFDAAEAIGAIAAYRVSKLAFVPAMLRFILSEPSALTCDLTSAELVLYGGSPMPRPLLEQAMALFRCRFVQNYGLSETCNMAIYMRAAEHEDPANPRLAAAGKPLRGVGVRIVDAAGQDLPAGATGEILFQTPVTMLEYWKRPAETAKALEAGWLHTGDAGHLDADGFLHVTDRIKDLIISAGENIYPAEIERILIEHPDIEDVAVIGIPDERWGEVPLAYVVAREESGLRPAAVMAFARRQLASFKLPREVKFIPALPRNPSGKILKRVLREPHWAGREKRVN